MQTFRALGALPTDSRASGDWGFCPQTPLASGGWGLRPQTLKTAPPLRISGYAPDCDNFVVNKNSMIRSAATTSVSKAKFRASACKVLLG